MAPRVWLILAAWASACAKPAAPAAPTADAGRDMCAEGHLQSPIDLHAVARRGGAKLGFDYRPDRLEIANNGRTVEIEHHAESRLWLDHRPFKLVQYHVHSPSEHTVEGQGFPLEIHFVHRDADGRLAVVGVLVREGVEEGREELAVRSVWSHLPRQVGQVEQVEAEVDPLDLIPPDHAHFFYKGSLTTPPCTEGVLWHVLATPLPMSAEHVAAFRELYSDNARPVQRPDWCPLKAAALAPP